MTEALARRFIYRWTEESSGSCTTPKVRFDQKKPAATKLDIRRDSLQKK
jgi:hypothetical protein